MTARKRNREADRAYSRAYQKARPWLTAEYNWRRLGIQITWDEFCEKNKQQAGLCRICGNPQSAGRRLSVDHDHDTNTVRDLLCLRCNILVGQIESGLVTKALLYLDHHA